MSKNYLLTTAQKVLFIQPKTPAMQELKSTLVQYNYEIIHWDAPNPYRFKELLDDENPDIVLVDISMFQEAMCRYAMVSAIKHHQSVAKVIFLTHTMESYVLEVAKACRASAYLLKPCPSYEVIVTLELALNREEQKTSFNYFELDYGCSYLLEKRQFFRKKEEIFLSKNGQKLMEILVKNRGSTVSLSQIIFHIWNKNYSLGSLRSLVYRIHKQIGYPLIENVKGVGYRVN